MNNYFVVIADMETETISTYQTNGDNIAHAEELAMAEHRLLGKPFNEDTTRIVAEQIN